MIRVLCLNHVSGTKVWQLYLKQIIKQLPNRMRYLIEISFAPKKIMFLLDKKIQRTADMSVVLGGSNRCRSLLLFTNGGHVTIYLINVNICMEITTSLSWCINKFKF